MTKKRNRKRLGKLSQLKLDIYLKFFLYLERRVLTAKNKELFDKKTGKFLSRLDKAACRFLGHTFGLSTKGICNKSTLNGFLDEIRELTKIVFQDTPENAAKTE